MEVTEVGIVISVNFPPLNAFAPIVSKPSCNVTREIPAFSNAPSPILEIPEGMTIEPIDLEGEPLFE